MVVSLDRLRSIANNPNSANKFYMLLTMACRALVGFSVYLILTRMLGPTNFGLMMTILSVATLAALVTDFGFGWKALRDIGATPESGRDIFLEAIRFKIGMTALIAAGGACAIAVLPLGGEYRIAAVLFGLGTLVAGIGDLGVVGYRATGRFRTETIVVVATSLIYAGAVVIAAFLKPQDLIAVGVAFLCGRSIYAVIAVLGPLASLRSTGAHAPRAVLRTVRETFPWFVDNALLVLIVQLDTILLAQSSVFSDVGIYQAGGRLLEHLFQLSTVLTSVHIPLLARSRIVSVDAYRHERRRAALEIGAAGIVAAFVAMAGGPVFTRHYLGADFSPLIQLWPGLAALLFLRFVTSGLGAILTASGHIRSRIIGETVGVIVTISAFYAIFPGWGLMAMPWIMCIGVTSIAACYSLILLRDEIGLKRVSR